MLGLCAYILYSCICVLTGDQFTSKSLWRAEKDLGNLFPRNDSRIKTFDKENRKKHWSEKDLNQNTEVILEEIGFCYSCLK